MQCGLGGYDTSRDGVIASIAFVLASLLTNSYLLVRIVSYMHVSMSGFTRG